MDQQEGGGSGSRSTDSRPDPSILLQEEDFTLGNDFLYLLPSDNEITTEVTPILERGSLPLSEYKTLKYCSYLPNLQTKKCGLFELLSDPTKVVCSSPSEIGTEYVPIYEVKKTGKRFDASAGTTIDEIGLSATCVEKSTFPGLVGFNYTLDKIPDVFRDYEWTPVGETLLGGYSGDIQGRDSCGPGIFPYLTPTLGFGGSSDACDKKAQQLLDQLNACQLRTIPGAPEAFQFSPGNFTCPYTPTLASRETLGIGLTTAPFGLVGVVLGYKLLRKFCPKVKDACDGCGSRVGAVISEQCQRCTSAIGTRLGELCTRSAEEDAASSLLEGGGESA